MSTPLQSLQNVLSDVVQSRVARQCCAANWLAGIIAFMLPVYDLGAGERFDQPQVAITIHDQLLRGAAEHENRRRSDVNTTILGSIVSGCQTTITNTSLTVQPSEDRARFLLISRGTVSTSTVSSQPRVTVHGNGLHDFEIIKPVEFDGNRLLTWAPYGRVTARETPQQISSSLDRVPVIGSLSNQIARSEVMRRQPQIQDAVAADVARSVLRQVNESVDARLSELSGQLKAIRGQMTNVEPLAGLQWTARSTPDALELSAFPRRRAGDEALRIPRGATRLGPDESIVVVVSEGFATQLANHFMPEGMSVSDTQLLASFSAPESLTLDMNTIRTLRPPTEAEASLFSIDPDPNQFLRLRFDSGTIEASLTGRVVPRLGLPGDWMTTQIVMRGEQNTRDDWTLRVLPQAAADNDNTTQAGTIWGSAIASVTNSLIDRVDGIRVSRWIPLNLPNQSEQHAQLVRIDCRDGLLRAAFRVAPVSPAN